jgi:CHAD domain-containing protein
LSAPERHKLRIKVKKLRYATEFFESLYQDADRSELARFSRRLKKLQDALGALNDFIAHREMATDAALSAPPENRRVRAFGSGVIVGQEHEAAKNSDENRAPGIRPLGAAVDIQSSTPLRTHHIEHQI